MKTTIHFYGQLSDITQAYVLEMEDLPDTDNVLKKLLEKFPALQQSKFTIAVDNFFIKENTPLQNNSIIALMPPFSGG